MQCACLGDSSKGKLILHVHISTVCVGNGGGGNEEMNITSGHIRRKEGLH